MVEAGTGTGKTLAYLVPALLSGKKVVVSTGTINLQEQIIEKDIPIIERAMGRSVQAVVLKGRNNYLCLRRYERFVRQRDLAFQKREVVCGRYRAVGRPDEDRGSSRADDSSRWVCPLG